MKCPNCKDTVLVIAERAGIEIDHCPDCRGVWLDRGELDKIIERNRVETPAYSERNDRGQPDRARDDYKYEKGYRKRKSFLEDLFD